jgi:hypothetical protein
LVVGIVRDQEREEAARVDEDPLHASLEYAAARCAYLSAETSWMSA